MLCGKRSEFESSVGIRTYNDNVNECPLYYHHCDKPFYNSRDKLTKSSLQHHLCRINWRVRKCEARRKLKNVCKVFHHDSLVVPMHALAPLQLPALIFPVLSSHAAIDAGELGTQDSILGWLLVLGWSDSEGDKLGSDEDSVLLLGALAFGGLPFGALLLLSLAPTTENSLTVLMFLFLTKMVLAAHRHKRMAMIKKLLLRMKDVTRFLMDHPPSWSVLSFVAATRSRLPEATISTPSPWLMLEFSSPAGAGASGSVASGRLTLLELCSDDMLLC